MLKLYFGKYLCNYSSRQYMSSYNQPLTCLVEKQQEEQRKAALLKDSLLKSTDATAASTVGATGKSNVSKKSDEINSDVSKSKSTSAINDKPSDIEKSNFSETKTDVASNSETSIDITKDIPHQPSFTSDIPIHPTATPDASHSSVVQSQRSQSYPDDESIVSKKESLEVEPSDSGSEVTTLTDASDKTLTMNTLADILQGDDSVPLSLVNNGESSVSDGWVKLTEEQLNALFVKETLESLLGLLGAMLPKDSKVSIGCSLETNVTFYFYILLRTSTRTRCVPTFMSILKF